MSKTNYIQSSIRELDIDFPSWANTEIYVKTISKGYLLPGEKPKDAYWRVCKQKLRKDWVNHKWLPNSSITFGKVG